MRVITLLLATFPAICFASPEGGGYLSYSLKAFGSLLIVLAVLFLGMYILKKINIASRFKSNRITLMDKLYIDNKHYIAIVRIDNEEFALGVGENINLIEKLGKHENDKS